MPQTVSPTDPRLRWPGAISLEATDEWVMPWRLPFDELALFDAGMLLQKASWPAGVRIAFRSDTTTVAGRIVPDAGMLSLDLSCDGVQVGSLPMKGKEEFRFDGLPAGEKAIELWLPQIGRFKLRELEIDDGARLLPWEDARPKWIAYGSSITHCKDAESPMHTWPAVVARERGLNHMNLGFGGQCHLDPMVARTMRDLPADLISICAGINIYGNGSLNPRSFRPAIIGFVKTLRDGHPHTPIAVMSPIGCPDRETKKNAVGFSLRDMREEVADAVARLRAAGDARVHYVNGLDILSEEHAERLYDGLHPDAEGYKIMGRNYLDNVIATAFPA